MDVSTANILNRTTQAFYAAQAESFSATRQSAWAGWQRVLANTGWEGESAGGVLQRNEGAGAAGESAGADAGAVAVGEGAVVGDGLASGEGADGADGVVRAGALDAAGVTGDGTCTSAFRTSEFGVRSFAVGAAREGAGAQREGALRCGEPEGADASASLVHRIMDVA